MASASPPERMLREERGARRGSEGGFGDAAGTATDSRTVRDATLRKRSMGFSASFKGETRSPR